MSNSWPIIAYPEGVIVGRVVSGRNKSGRLRNVAYLSSGKECRRLGTFDTFREAKAKVIDTFREAQQKRAS